MIEYEHDIDFIDVFDAIKCFKEKGSPWNLSDGNRNKELVIVPGCDTGVMTVFIHIFDTGYLKLLTLHTVKLQIHA